jgi:hypothetical protein
MTWNIDHEFQQPIGAVDIKTCNDIILESRDEACHNSGSLWQSYESERRKSNKNQGD